MSKIQHVAVVGCGLMGSGIAEILARAGLPTIVIELDDAALSRGKDRVMRSFDRAISAGKITDEDRGTALGQLTFSSDLGSVAQCDVVFEAIAELETLKANLYSSLDGIVQSPDAIFASNTSSFPIARLGTATNRPENVIGVHFFNPVPVMPLVEITSAIRTSEQTTQLIADFITERLGKTIIRSTDRAGFIVNTLLVPYLLSAIRMVESGFADSVAVDAGMEKGCGMPMGPLRLADFIGLDTLQFIAEALYGEYKEPQYAAPPLLRRMVDANILGKKSGQGFYDYTNR